MSPRWVEEPLGELCDISIGRTPARADYRYWRNGTVPWLSIADMSQGIDIVETRERITAIAVAECGGRLVNPGTLVMSFKLSVGKLGFVRVPMYTNEAIAALPVRAGKNLDPRFLYRALQVARLSEGADRAVKGLTLNSEKLARIRIPYPTDWAEQRRIADIFDKADAIHRTRKEAIALTDELLRSAFLEMFGDPVTNVKGWPVKPFRELLAMPLRNGLSPASSGRYAARVLTLSAITRRVYDPTAWKDGMFAVEPWDDVRVDRRDFLICRGNGNKELVGRGAFPFASDSSLVFPDTMIAARIDDAQVAAAFLASIWKSPRVRSQLEASARTTNGTFKINQGAVEAVEIVCPPRELQEPFQRLADRSAQTLARYQEGRSSAERLFDSLVARAFSGRLGTC